jgi:hypothetical protein
MIIQDVSLSTYLNEAKKDTSFFWFDFKVYLT